jgi:hypothetical protein
MTQINPPNLLDPQTYIDILNEGDRIDDERVRRALEIAMLNATAHEREACLGIASEWTATVAGAEIAKAIRARTKPGVDQ